MNFQDLIKPELLILIPVIYLVGVAFKKSEVNNKYIPLILGCISIFLCGFYTFATCNFSNLQDVLIAIFTSISQGILISGASVYVNQIYKQLKKRG